MIPSDAIRKTELPDGNVIDDFRIVKEERTLGDLKLFEVFGGPFVRVGI